MRSVNDSGRPQEWGLWLRSVNEGYDWGQWMRSMTEVSEWGLWQRSVNEITGWGKWTRSMTEVSDWGQWGFVLEYLGIEFWTKDTFPRNCPVVDTRGNKKIFIKKKQISSPEHTTNWLMCLKSSIYKIVHPHHVVNFRGHDTPIITSLDFLKNLHGQGS